MSAALEVQGLAAGYGGQPVLSGVSFAAEAGSSVCVLGPNGGGKTTLFRALIGQLPLAAGTVRIQGRPAHVAQAEHAAAGLPGQRARRGSHGLAGRALVAARPAPRPRRAPGRRSRASACRGAERTASARCRAASASAC